MDNYYQLNTWEGLLSLVILLTALYWLIKGLLFLLKELGKRTVTNRNTQQFIKKSLIVYKPIAAVIIVLDFMAINYITHSLLLIVLGVFGYKHVKNYLNGVFLKLNPLMTSGAQMTFQNTIGEIKRLLTFGLILSTEKGEHFVNYSVIEEQGFAINSHKHSALRQTLFIESELEKETLLDMLFDNPILNFKEPPVLNASEKEAVHKLQFTLETGASTEDLTAFFKAKNIIAHTTLSN